MLKVLISDTKTLQKWFDLADEADRQEALEFTDDIFDQNIDYVIQNVQSEWAQYDEYTDINDMVATMVALEQLNLFEQEHSSMNIFIFQRILLYTLKKLIY